VSQRRVTTSFRAAAEAALPTAVVDRLNSIGRLGERLGVPVLLVGGAVRDTLLGRVTGDVDLLTLGDPGELLAGLRAVLGRFSLTASRLMTHHLDLADGGRIEVAQARRDAYPRPGALPEVTPGSLDEDLERRDFTVNAMAVPLGVQWGEVIDPAGGMADLGARALRTLHPGSFRDDPTRVLRGIELAVRLDFEFADATAEDARTALAQEALDTLSQARWSNAWGRSFGRLLRCGPVALERGFQLASDLGLDRALGARFPETTEGAVERLAAAPLVATGGEMEAGRLLLRWLAGSDGRLAGRWAGRLGLGLESVGAWESLPARAASLRSELPEAAHWPLSHLDRALGAFDSEELALLAADSAAEFDDMLERHRRDVGSFTLDLRGADLVARGFAPGPAIGRVLAEVRGLRLDGELTRAEELEYACRLLEADGG
jgi:tRNA nucleotidyltransferase (CCA-adding enzyme)